MTEEKKSPIIYELYGKTYINLTNSCTNKCLFCIKSIKDDVTGFNMILENDNLCSKDVIEAIEQNRDKIHDEVVYCGYGEPTLRLEALLESAKFLKKSFKGIKLRLNTNGHANFIYKRDVVPELSEVLDSVSISLNAENEQLYNEISQPNFKEAYFSMLEFVSLCVKAGLDTTVTVVTGFKDFKINIKECQKIAEKLGAKFRERPFLNEGY